MSVNGKQGNSVIGSIEAESATLDHGVFEYVTTNISDNRGMLKETLNKNSNTPISDFKIELELEVQSVRGVVRGFHYQKGNYAQGKLVRVLQGRILDAVVDLREGSSGFGTYSWRFLEAGDNKILYIPKGFAHAYQALEESTILYKLDAPYSSNNSLGLLYCDDLCPVPWDNSIPHIVSDTDRTFQTLSQTFGAQAK